jgi:hypothetical protein
LDKARKWKVTAARATLDTELSRARAVKPTKKSSRPARIQTLNAGGGSPTLDFMAKCKKPETGEGYLGETMVHRISRAVGVVDSVLEAKAGWPPEITLKLKDGSFKKGKLSDFREPTSAERKQISPL